MAQRGTVKAFIAPALVAGAVLLGIVPLIVFASGQSGAMVPDAYVFHVLQFTLWQAGLSTLLSVVPAVFLARALVRRGFPGRHLFTGLLAVPLSLPAIVAVFGITSVFGNSGWLGGHFNLYGLTGILMAHVFFNLPLATRFFVEALEAIPPENHRLAAQLGFNDWQVVRMVDVPVLRKIIWRVSALVFLLCAASFVVILTLGGGPAA
jgi:thiamine transport system permease protein